MAGGIKRVEMKPVSLCMSSFLGEKKRLLILLSTLIAIPILAANCSGDSSNTVRSNGPDNSSQLNVYFLVQKERQTEILTAALSGELVCNDGYLRVLDFIVIWPYGYSVRSGENELLVINDRGESLARVGDGVRLEGGEIPASVVEDKIGQKLPSGVQGPFWLVGRVTKN